MEFNYTIGAELEFYLFDEDNSSIADLNSGEFPKKKFDILDDFKQTVEDLISEFQDFNIEYEDGPGQLEAHFSPKTDYKELAEKIEDFKQKLSAYANSIDLKASFEAKPIEKQLGSSLHIHLSSDLFDPYGLEVNDGVMPMKNEANNDYLLWAIGGCLEKLPENIDVFLPTDASKERIKAWLNAPTKICWGGNNRSVAIRVPDSRPRRLEHRLAGADANPDKVCRAIIEAAIYGISNRIDPGEKVFGNAWDGKYKFPLIV